MLNHSRLGLSGGFVGVDVFFVISGFLITGQLSAELSKTNRISFAKFYARRARRILPAATLVIVATLLASWLWLSPLRLHSVTRDGIFAAVSGLNYRLAAQGTDYFQAAAPPSPFQHYWTLGVEEQFYVLWPLLMVVSVWLIGRWLRSSRALSAVLLAVIAASVWLSVGETATAAPWAYFGLHTRAWELALGGLLAVNFSWLSRMPRSLAAAVSWAGLGGIVAAGLWYTASTPYPGIAAMLPVAGSALVIAAGCAAPPRGVETLLRLSPFQFGGRVSYSWYLWHWPVLIILPAILARGLSKAESMGAIAFSLGLATLTYYGVEQPFRSRKGLVQHPWRGLTVGAGLAAISIIAAVIVSSQVVIPGGDTKTAASQASARPVRLAKMVRPARASTRGPVEQAVADATKLVTLPSDLSPPLAKAHDDMQPGCIDGLAAVRPDPVKNCVLGDTASTRTVVLFGESHAWQWIPALSRIAKLEHWKLVVFTKGACPLEIHRYFTVAVNRIFTECDTWRSVVLDRIKRMRPKMVIVSTKQRQEGTPRAMAVVISTLVATKAKVVLIEDTPYPGEDIPDCLATNPNSIQACSVARSRALQFPTQRRAESRAALNAGALVVDPSPWFCSGTVCPAVISHKVVYADKEHMTATYAAWLVPALSAHLPALP